jgi:YhcH/YjgK/YiaL family protein
MILDILENAHIYTDLNPHFDAAFKFLCRTDITDLPEGRSEIDGENVYATIVKGPGRKPENAQIETHDKYIDIHYIIDGTDTMGWKARKDLGPTTDASDPKNDIVFYEDDSDVWTAVKPGMFTVFFPEDAHLPMISDDTLHKVIIKVIAN